VVTKKTKRAQSWGHKGHHFEVQTPRPSLCSMYRVAQKRKPLPNYEKIVSNRIKVCQYD